MKKEKPKMSIDLSNLIGVPRLLVEADLKPIQGATFQPTGFPDLGAATYKGYDENGDQTEILLVESQQSMANRLETVCWDAGSDGLVSVLDGMPYVKAELWGGGKFTNSILEAHRMAAPYITGKNVKMKNGGGEKPFGEFFKEEASLSDPIDVRALAKALFKYDPSSVLHGVFMAQMGGLRVEGGGFEIPETSVLESDLPGLLRACADDGLFAKPPVTEVAFA